MKKAFSYGDRSIDSAVARINRTQTVAIIGAGTMGQGIAIDLLKKTHYRLILLDVQAEALDRARTTIEQFCQEQVDRGQVSPERSESLKQRTRYTQNYDDLKESDILWEVATERIDVKTGIFKEIEAALNPDRVAAVFSNTSSHTTSELSALFTSLVFRSKCLTVHGYYPFESNRLIDVMKGKYTSEDTFYFGKIFADQILEKAVIALSQDHHGYITDPIFQAMAAIISWDVRTAQDIVNLGSIWELFTSNPFTVLDFTGHMPYVESSRHFGKALPQQDRLRDLYNHNGDFYPSWIARLQDQGHTGVHSKTRKGFYEWSQDPHPKPIGVYDPASNEYVPIRDVPEEDFRSWYQSESIDRRMGKMKSCDSLLHVACADDAAGRAFRRYVLPVCLYALDLIQDGVASPGQINLCTRAGLRFKVGIIEFIDALLTKLTIDGMIQLIQRAREENSDDLPVVQMLDVCGQSGPRKDHPSLILKMQERGIHQLLGYGKYYHTPISELIWETGTYQPAYPELSVYEPAPRDRVASVVFNCPLRGNVLNKAMIDQLADAFHRILRWHRDGSCGAVLFTAAGSGMRMLGADAREFNRGWFDRHRGYAPLSEEEAAASSRNAVSVFRLIQRSPLASLGAFGEKWGGGAEFTYFLDLRYDLRTWGFVYDSLKRESRWQQKNTYNQPELDYAILPGFGGVGELKRLGMGDSAIFEIFDQGLSADRAYTIGLSNGVFDDELEILQRGYERARQMAKDAPYSRALFKKELARGADDEALAKETGETFNPRKNPYISKGLLSLLDRHCKAPQMSYSCQDTQLPGWVYPTDNGTEHKSIAKEAS